MLVTSYSPLKVYMYTDGLVRFATEPYSNDPSQLNRKFVHLTNFSVNKKNINFVKNEDQRNQGGPGVAAEEDDDGSSSSKWDFN